MQQMVNDDPQQFFKHVNNSRKQSDDLPSTMKFNDKQANSPHDISNLFHEFLSSAYIISSTDSIDLYEEKSLFHHKIQDICTNIPPINLTEEIISQRIKELPDNLVKGPDNIPNIFIKRCASSLLSPIFKLLKTSLENGITPTIWKSSYVRPIFKNGSKIDVQNYRGVAVQCTIPKLLDSTKAKHFNSYLHNVLTEHQHGFVRGKSTTTNLIEYTHRIIDSLQTNQQVDSIYLDISKAFDTVDTHLLMHKLKLMGVNQQLLNWLTDYVKERKQYVKLSESITSEPINVTSGVGQGYPIGAVLFILFIADLPFYMKKSSISLFADDSKIMLPINTINDCNRLQRDLENAAYFFNINKLKLNVRKSKVITFFKRAPIIQYALVYFSVEK